MRERQNEPNDTPHADLGGSPPHRRESYSDPVTAAEDAPERASVLAAGATSGTPATEVEAIARQPSDRGGFGVHRPPDSKRDSSDAGAPDAG
jgi:hypothetical protein